MASTALHPYPYVRWTLLHAVAAGSRMIDRLLGISTTFPAPTGIFADYDRTLFESKPVGWTVFFRAFRTLRIAPDDTLLDIGAGAGRAAICASFFPFRRVIGVEIKPEVFRRAQQNARSLRSRRRERIDFVCADATSYHVPDDITVIFMYNPFNGEIFERTMAQIFASLDRAPRRLRLIYNHPKEQSFLERTGRCRLVRRIGGLRPNHDWAFMLSTNVYELLPATAAKQTAPVVAGRG